MWQAWKNSSQALWVTSMSLCSIWAITTGAGKITGSLDLSDKKTWSLISITLIAELFSCRECHDSLDLVRGFRLWHLIYTYQSQVARMESHLWTEENCQTWSSAVFLFGRFSYLLCWVVAHESLLESPLPPASMLGSFRTVFAAPDCIHIVFSCGKDERVQSPVPKYSLALMSA